MYDLIWKRTIASQMSDAKYETTTVTLAVDRRTGAARRVHRIRHRLHLQGIPRGVRRGPRREAQRRRQGRRPVAAGARRRRHAAPEGGRAEGARDHPEAPLHRGEPRQGARGEGHRPPVDVREHHRRDPRSRLRHQARPGARAELARVQRHPAARGALRRPGRLRLHRRARGRPRRDRPRRAAAHRLAQGLLLRLRRPAGSAQHRREPRRDRRARAELHARSATPTTLRFGKYGPYLDVDRPRRIPRPRRGASTSPRSSRPTS